MKQTLCDWCKAPTTGGLDKWLVEFLGSGGVQPEDVCELCFSELRSAINTTINQRRVEGQHEQTTPTARG